MINKLKKNAKARRRKEKTYFKGIKLLLAEGYPAYPAHLVIF